MTKRKKEKEARGEKRERESSSLSLSFPSLPTGLVPVAFLSLPRLEIGANKREGGLPFLLLGRKGERRKQERGS